MGHPAGRHIGSVGGGSTFFHSTDWLGTTREWTNLSGGTYTYCQNTYFGDHQYDCTPPDFFGPGDLYSDGEDNLYHAMYRQLSSYQAHWMSPDPAGLAAANPSNPQSWNRYAYVMNNPLSFIDPTGLACYPIEGGGGGGCNGGQAGFGCTMDGVDAPCNMVFATIAGGGAVQCLFNSCAGYGTTWKLSDTGTDYMLLVGSSNSFNEDELDAGAWVHDTRWADLGPAAMWDSVNSVTDQSANNGTPSWFQRGLNYLKSHPITISVNEIFAGQITYQASTGTICGSVGAGASVPPTKAVTVGILNEGSMNNWQGVVTGPSYSFGANLFLGYQGMFSSSGKVGGPTVSGIGLSGSYTIGGCTTIP
jgi:RHS repeat-associated protein